MNKEICRTHGLSRLHKCFLTIDAAVRAGEGMVGEMKRVLLVLRTLLADGQTARPRPEDVVITAGPQVLESFQFFLGVGTSIF